MSLLACGTYGRSEEAMYDIAIALCPGTYAAVDRAELLWGQLRTNPVNSEARSQ